jgi:hypothetical protein
MAIPARTELLGVAAERDRRQRMARRSRRDHWKVPAGLGDHDLDPAPALVI